MGTRTAHRFGNFQARASHPRCRDVSCTGWLPEVVALRKKHGDPADRKRVLSPRRCPRNLPTPIIYPRLVCWALEARTEVKTFGRDVWGSFDELVSDCANGFLLGHPLFAV